MRLAADNPGVCWTRRWRSGWFEVLTIVPAPFTVAPFGPAGYIVLHLVQAVVALLVMIPVFFGNPNFGLPARFLGHPSMLWLGCSPTGSISGA